MNNDDYMILTDEDVRLMPMALAVKKMEDTFRELAAGNLNAPPRFRVTGKGGDLVFTAGSAAGGENVLGFRVYDTFPGTSVSAEQKQIVAVYSNKDGRFKGLVIGRLLGSMRTGGIGGVAIDYLARQDTKVLAVIGTGYHAATQVRAAFVVRDFDQVRFYNRTRSKADKFAAKVAKEYNVKTKVMKTARDAVDGADVVLTVTNSRTPVLESAWLKPGVHVNNIGPKLASGHELPVDMADVCDLIACDSIQQAEGHGEPFYLPTNSFVSLDKIVTGQAAGRPSAEARTLFASVGLAGTEVILANALIEMIMREIGSI